jgi:hypothetical protein
MSTPALASVVAFIVYAATGHQLSAAVIFSSLTWFQLLRMPLMLLRKSRNFLFDLLRRRLIARSSSYVL